MYFVRGMYCKNMVGPFQGSRLNNPKVSLKKLFGNYFQFIRLRPKQGDPLQDFEKRIKDAILLNVSKGYNALDYKIIPRTPKLHECCLYHSNTYFQIN